MLNRYALTLTIPLFVSDVEIVSSEGGGSDDDPTSSAGQATGNYIKF